MRFFGEGAAGGTGSFVAPVVSVTSELKENTPAAIQEWQLAYQAVARAREKALGYLRFIDDARRK